MLNNGASWCVPGVSIPSGDNVGYWLLQSWEYFMAEGCFIYKTNDRVVLFIKLTMTDPQA